MSVAAHQGRHFRWMSITAVVSMVVGLIVGAQTARQFGLSGNGDLAFFNAIVFPVTFLGASWLLPAFVRDLNREKEAIAEIVWTNVIMKLVLCSALSLLTIYVAYLLDASYVQGAILISILIGNVVQSCGLSQAFDAFHKGGYEAFWRMASRMIYLGLAIWLLYGKNIGLDHIWMIPAAETLSQIVYILGLWIIFHFKISPLPMRFSTARARAHFQFGKPIIFSGFNEKIVGNVDVALLYLVGGPMGQAWAAIYAVPQRLLRIIRQQMVLFNRMISPMVLSLWDKEKAKASEAFQFGFHAVGSLLMMLIVVIAFFADEFIEVLFSAQYLEARWSLVFLTLALSFRLLGKSIHAALIAAGLNKVYANNEYILGGVALIGLSIGIPLASYNGAAIAVACAYGAQTFFGWKKISKEIEPNYHPRFVKLVTPAIAGASAILLLVTYLDAVALNLGEFVLGYIQSFIEWITVSLSRDIEEANKIVTLGVALTFKLVISSCILICAFMMMGPLTKAQKARLVRAVGGMIGSKKKAVVA